MKTVLSYLNIPNEESFYEESLGGCNLRTLIVNNDQQISRKLKSVEKLFNPAENF